MRTWIGVGLLCCLVLAGCGGGGGGGTTSSPGNIINGQANLGIVNGGLVTAYKLSGGVKGAALAAASTNSKGDFALDVGSYSGPVLLELTNPGGATYLDEAKAAFAPLPGPMRSVLPAVVNGQTVAITPLTEIVAAGAIKKALAGTSDELAINLTRSQVAVAFLAGADPVTTIPDDVSTILSGDAARGRYASVLAAMANVANAAGSDLYTLAAAYAASLFPNATTTGTLASADVTKLQNAAAAFAASPPAGINAPPAAVPSGNASVVDSMYGNPFFYAYFQSAATSDYLERGSMNFLFPTAQITPIQAWENGNVTAAGSSYQATVSKGADGQWSFSNPYATLTGYFSPDGQVFAGATIQTGNTHHILVGVRKAATAPTLAGVAGTYNFIEMGGATFTAETFHGSVTLDGAGGVSGSAKGSAVSSPISGSYSIDLDGSIKIVNGTQTIVILPAENGRYGVFIDTDSRTRYRGLGFAIKQGTAAPVTVGLTYRYAGFYSINGVSQSQDGLVTITGGYTGKGSRKVNNGGAVSTQALSFAFSQPSSTGALTLTDKTPGFINQPLSGWVSADGNLLILELPYSTATNALGMVLAIRQ